MDIADKDEVVEDQSSMNLKVFDYKGFCSYENKSLYPITMKILKNSKSRLHKSSTTTNPSGNVQCESSSQGYHLDKTKEESRRESRPPLEGVVRCSANYVPLSPISYLERAAEVYRDQTSIVYGSIKYTWEETHRRCLKLASALNRLGVSRGDIVATLAPNVPAMLELHFAVPMSGGILCTLNTRLDPSTLSTQLKHSEAKILFVDYQFMERVEMAINLLKHTHSKPPLLVIIHETDSLSPLMISQEYEYESLVTSGVTEFSIIRPHDECDPISVSYTSGTTSRPKAVVYSHRGAYLNSLACVFMYGMKDMPTYLWSVPMFHCNGWCFPWGMAIVGGTNICLRRSDPKDIFENIVLHKVTHMGGAPTVLNMIVNYLVDTRKRLPHRVEILTGGAPPPPIILSKIEELGFHVSHIYGLTETYGPGTWCLWKPEWDSLPIEEQMKFKSRHGVKHFGMEEVDVKDPITMESVKHDGKSIGEIMFRGNTVMSGYMKDLRATQEAFAGGWFRSGDLGIKHPNGYIEVKDRLKDIVISGGENISTIEVETVIYSHPAVLEVAVVARPDDHWGETPCAFVKLKDGVCIDSEDIIQHCRDHMPHYMVPRTVIFEDLPRNSTGKVQKFVEKAKTLGKRPPCKMPPSNWSHGLWVRLMRTLTANLNKDDYGYVSRQTKNHQVQSISPHCKKIRDFALRKIITTNLQFRGSSLTDRDGGGFKYKPPFRCEREDSPERDTWQSKTAGQCRSVRKIKDLSLTACCIGIRHKSSKSDKLNRETLELGSLDHGNTVWNE
ncbi:hypothetical protein OSB04_012236 [Centaurea solstitialis]|uniref:4-coumarate--CoA ligase n=1 Tax=Centaurea solstitialis TaxID=347529 RepID=A0AA38TU29_9ASTR|nr:hypothetical protein OSB04_012236 [Centaurea solstitialis]